MKSKKKSGENLRKSGKSQGKIREFDGINKVGTLLYQMSWFCQCLSDLFLPPANEVAGRECFHKVSVCHSVQGSAHVTITHDALGHGYPLHTRHGTHPHPPATDIRWLSLETCSNKFTWGPLPPLVLTSSDGHRNTCGWQVGCAHPSVMLPCWTCFLLVVLFIKGGCIRVTL